MSSYKDQSLAYLREVIEKTGKTPTELARLVDVNQTTFTRPLNNLGHKYAIKFQSLQALAHETGIPLPEALVAAQASSRKDGPVDIRLPIKYEVAASGFLERDEMPQRPLGYRVVRSAPGIAPQDQWLEQVGSDSMDRLLPVGSIIHVVSAIAIGYRPSQGDIVVVERTRFQGAMVERTVKQVMLTPAGPELWPRSHNERWQQPIRLAELDDDIEQVTVQIVGKVIRAVVFFEDEAEETEAA